MYIFHCTIASLMYYQDKLCRSSQARVAGRKENEPVILETDHKERLFKVRSSKDSEKFYRVDTNIKTHTCPDFNYRFLICLHIFAADFAFGAA